jgi:capsular polysaccharide transport system permease protein
MTSSVAYPEIPAGGQLAPNPSAQVEQATRGARAIAQKPTFADEESRVDVRRRLRAEAQKQRLRHRMLMIGLILAPVVVVSFYLFFLASPRYVAESRFSVQASQSATGGGSGANSPITSLLSSGSTTNAAAGFVDGWLVQDFLNSRDCMRQLDQRIGLRKYLTRTGLDPLNNLSPRANDDDLYAAYRRVVRNSFNMIESVNTLDVAAFSPQDSVAISNGLLEVTQDFVNRMDQQGINDALKVNRQTVESAEAQDKTALAALARWRTEHGDVDPAAKAAMLLSQIGLEESALSAAEVSLEQIKAMHNPQHPMLKPAEGQVQDLQRRVSELRAQMSGDGNTSASEMKSYVELTNAQTYADTNLLSARQNYQQALANALALQRYLRIVARPVPEVVPSQPNPYFYLFVAMACGCALAGTWTLCLGVYRSFRHA